MLLIHRLFYLWLFFMFGLRFGVWHLVVVVVALSQTCSCLHIARACKYGLNLVVVSCCFFHGYANLCLCMLSITFFPHIHVQLLLVFTVVGTLQRSAV